MPEEIWGLRGLLNSMRQTHKKGSGLHPSNLKIVCVLVLLPFNNLDMLNGLALNALFCFCCDIRPVLNEVRELK